MNPRQLKRFVLAAVWCALLRAPGRRRGQPFRAARFVRTCSPPASRPTRTAGWSASSGRVFHTTDGGKTFARSDTGTRAAFLAVACLPDGSVVVTGPKGLAMTSRDQGETWEKLDTGVKRDLLSVALRHAAGRRRRRRLRHDGAHRGRRHDVDEDRAADRPRAAGGRRRHRRARRHPALRRRLRHARARLGRRRVRRHPHHRRRRQDVDARRRARWRPRCSACSSPTPATAGPPASSR